MPAVKQIRLKPRDVARAHGWRTVFVVLAVVLLASVAYTAVRYVFFKGESLAHAPLYLFNKALSLASVFLIGLSFLWGPLCRFWPKTFVPKLYLRKYLGLAGFGLASVHALVSLALLTSAYYPKFFEASGKLNASGETSVLFGILAFFVFAIVSVSSLPFLEVHLDPKQWLFIQRLGYAAYILVLGHVATMGFSGWFSPTSWPGGLLPISLVAAMVILLVLAVRALVLVLPPLKSRS